ncbi:MAG: PadR family transcriptional regulator [Anaerolineae bacterium]
MALEYAILGFLNYGAFSGYDLKKALDASIKHFWSANQSQIYRTLSRLSEDGWVEMDVVEQDTRPDRKVYHITEAGKTALHDWLLSPLPFETEHSATLIQIFFSAQLDNEVVLAALEQQAKLLRTRLAEFEAIPKQAEAYIQQVDSSRDVAFWTLTLDYGIQLNRAKLAWVEAAIRTIQDIPPHDSE